MSEQRTDNDLRDRALLPVLIPVGAILITETVVFSLSRVLLATGELIAVGVALGVALSILIGAAAIASRPRISTTAIAGFLVAVLLGVVAAGAVAAKHGPYYAKESGGAMASMVHVTADKLAFDTKTISLPATGAAIEFHNMDVQPHNIAIFTDAKSLDSPLFRGAITNAGTVSEYKVGSLKAGSYYFHCDVHPTQMFGSVVVK